MGEEGFDLGRTLGKLAGLVGSLMPARDAARIKTFQEQIAEITSRREKIKLTRGDYERYCLGVKEPNQGHVNTLVAQSLGFDDVFAPGMQLAALGEQFINELVVGINAVVEEPYAPTQMNVGFGRKVVYPDSSLTWLCYDYDISQEERIVLSILGAERRNLKDLDLDQKITRALRKDIKRRGTTIDVVLGHELPRQDKGLYGANHSQAFRMSGGGVADFLLSIHEEPGEHQEVPWMYGPAFFPASIFAFFVAKMPESVGIHVDSHFTFYERPCINSDLSIDSPLVVELFARDSKRMVDVVASQKHKALIYSMARFMPAGKTGVGRV